MREMLLQILLGDPFTTFLLIINLIFIFVLLSGALSHLDQFGGADLGSGAYLRPVILLPVRLLLLSPLVRALRLPVLAHAAPFIIRVDCSGILLATIAPVIAIGVGI